MKIRTTRVCAVCGNEIKYANYKFESYRCTWCGSTYPTKDIVVEKTKGKKR